MINCEDKVFDNGQHLQRCLIINFQPDTQKFVQSLSTPQLLQQNPRTYNSYV